MWKSLHYGRIQADDDDNTIFIIISNIFKIIMYPPPVAPVRVHKGVSSYLLIVSLFPGKTLSTN